MLHAFQHITTDTFMPLVESGNCPTIFETWFTEPQKLIKAGAVADITDELEARGWLDKMNPSVKALLSDENGRVYGVPRDGYALGLMLNVEVFEEAGLVDENGYPIYPKTWDELAETAKTIKDKTGSAGICLLAKDNAGGWHFSNIAWAFGATLCTDNGDGTFTAHLDSDEAIAAMEYVKSLKWDYDVLTADPTNEDWGTGFTELGTGAAAMYIAANDAVNQPTQVNGLPEDKLAMCPIPEGPGGQYSLYGGTPYMFSKDATEDEINAALDYLEIMGKAPVVTDASIAGLEADAKNRVLLPSRQVPEGTKEGDSIEAFIYKDSQDRLIATTKEPKLQVGQTAVLKVSQVTRIGAFLDWGLEKDLLLPYHEQTLKVREGEDVLVALYIDKSSRLCATMKVYHYLSTRTPYVVGDMVKGRVYEISDRFGVFVAVDDKYSALIPAREAKGKYRPGKILELRVSEVKEDGKMNVTDRQKAYLQINEDAENVLEVINEFAGVLPFDDKASPEVIQREFGLSKGAFKRAIGHLMKEGKVEIKDKRIYAK